MVESLMQKLTVSSLKPYILRSSLEIREMNQLVLDYLEETSIPLTALRQGLTLCQGYNKHVKMNVIHSLHNVNHLEFDHWILQDRLLPVQWRHDLWWNIFHNACYEVTNPEYIGWCAVVHTVDPKDLAILLYAYEGEELCSVLEGNGLRFLGSDSRDCFIHFQGDEILPGEQQHYGVYFPLFPHTNALDDMETMLVPNVDSPEFSYEYVDLWQKCQWYNPLRDVPWISEWNEYVDQMWRSAFHKRMDPYFSILKQCTEDPLLETIIELEQQLKDTVKSATDFSTDTNALLAEVSKSVMAGLSQKWPRREEREEGKILGMENPDQDRPSPPRQKRTHRVAPTGIIRKSVCMQHTAVPYGTAPSLVSKFL